MEPMDRAIDAGMQDPPAASDATAAAALQVLAAQPAAQPGHCRRIYENMLQLATGQINYSSMLMCPVCAAVQMPRLFSHVLVRVWTPVAGQPVSCAGEDS